MSNRFPNTMPTAFSVSGPSVSLALPEPVYREPIVLDKVTDARLVATATAPMPDGGWIALWYDENREGAEESRYEIVAQRFAADGTYRGEAISIYRSADDRHIDPLMDVTGIPDGPNAGGFVVTWIEKPNGVNHTMMLQSFDAAGQPLGAPKEIASGWVDLSAPKLAAAPDGGIVLTWTTGTNDFQAHTLFAQRFGVDGAALGAPIMASVDAALSNRTPEIAMLSDGGFAMSWLGYDDLMRPAASAKIVSRRFDAEGEPVTDEFLAFDAANGTIASPDIAELADGRLVVTWRDQSDVFARLFDANGVAQGDPILIAQQELANRPTEPSVMALPDGGFAVGYALQNIRNDVGTPRDVRVQFVDALGQLVGDPVVVDGASTPGNADFRALSFDALTSGDILAVWSASAYVTSSNKPGLDIGLQVLGNPADYLDPADIPRFTFAPGAGIRADENDLNAKPVAFLSTVDLDADPVFDFSGATLRVRETLRPEVQDDQPFADPDNGAQHLLSLLDAADGGAFRIVGSNVFHDPLHGIDPSDPGTLPTPFAVLTSDGTAGTPLEARLATGVTRAEVVSFLRNVTYQNGSDDPVGTSISIDIIGAEGRLRTSDPVRITVLPERDGFETLGAVVQANSFQRNAQQDPAIAALDSGGHVITWTSFDEDAGLGDDGVFAQVFDSTGQARGLQFQVNALAAGHQRDARVAGLNAEDGGGFVVVWRDVNKTDGHIKARIYNDDGSARTREFRVETEQFKTQQDPDVVALPNGFLVVWSSENDESRTKDIRGQYFDPNGTPRGAEFTVNADVTNGTQIKPDVATNSFGAAIIVWEDLSGRDGSLSGVFGQRLDANGAPVGSEFQVNETTQKEQFAPTVAYLADGRFIVSWTDASGLIEGNDAAMARLFAADGTPIGGEFLVADNAETDHHALDVAGLANGGFAITFDDRAEDNRDVSEIFLQQYNPDGSRRDGPLTIAEAEADQSAVRIAEVVHDGQAGLAAAWVRDTDEEFGDGDGLGVFTRLIGNGETFNDPARMMPDLRDLSARSYIGIDGIEALQSIDPGIALTLPTDKDLGGGKVSVTYLGHLKGGKDQLGIIDGKAITRDGATVFYDGIAIGRVDATRNGVDGADLVIHLEAAATETAVRYLIEQIGFSGQASDLGTTRNFEIRITDAHGLTSPPDSVQLNIVKNDDWIFTNRYILLKEVDDQTVTESEAAAGVFVDPFIELAYTGVSGFVGGKLELKYRFPEWKRPNPDYETLAIADEGTGPNQIAVAGSQVFFEGSLIGEISDSWDGQNGARLSVTLTGSASPRAVDALVESLVYTNTWGYARDPVEFIMRLWDGGGRVSPEIYVDIGIERDPVPDLIRDDVYTLSAEDFLPAGSDWIRLGSVNENTGILVNDPAPSIGKINGAPFEPGVWFDGLEGGQFRVFSSGVVDFRNQGERIEVGETTSFVYGPLRSDVSDEATVSLTVAPIDDYARDDRLELTATALEEAGPGWVRLARLGSEHNPLANDIGVARSPDTIEFINGSPLVGNAWVDGSNGGQFRLFSSGVIDFRAQGAPIGPGESTSIRYGFVFDDTVYEADVTLVITDDFDI